MTSPVQFHASKWLKIQMLIDEKELEHLFADMGEFSLHPIGRVIDAGKEATSQKDYLNLYASYIQPLKKGGLPGDEVFASAITSDRNDLHIATVGNDQRLTRILRPVVQVQPYRFGYSSLDGKFRSNVLGKESVNWGLQFSYPQIYQEPHTKEVLNASDQKLFPNAIIFKKIQRWIRQNTIPTPLVADDKLTHVPFRIGKKCLPWINQHPQLIQLNIKVVTNSHVES